MNNNYKNPEEFRIALNKHLKSLRTPGAPQGELEAQKNTVAFDRFLARVSGSPDSKWVLKGGYSMNLRFKKSRSTKDMDFALLSDPGSLPGDKEERLRVLEDMLSCALDKDMGDFFSYKVGRGKTLMEGETDGAPGGGARIPVQAYIGNKLFTSFHVDIGIADYPSGVEMVRGSDTLGFAGITPPMVLAVSKEQQLSEKLHAYTVPRGKFENTRFKDLVDMSILVSDEEIDKDRSADAIRDTFARRSSHPFPDTVLPPIASWARGYSRLATQCGISPDMNEAYLKVKSFIDNLDACRIKKIDPTAARNDQGHSSG